MRQIFNHYSVFNNQDQHLFSILTDNGLNWNGKKFKPTMHVAHGTVCVEISRRHAARALIEARRNGFIVKPKFK